MENTPYASVFGSGTPSTCPTSSAPFLCSMLPYSSTVPSMNNYGATSADSNDFNGCSAACYVGFMLGYTYGVSDGYSFSSISGNPQFVNALSVAGLTWQAYCESGCPRGNDHFPFAGSNTFTSSSVAPSTLITAANSANPPNFLWYTPTDSHNMHDVTVSTGDSYLRSFLVGSGSITNPATGSLLASSLFSSSSYRTMLYIWWDECGGNNGSCDSNNDAPNIMYGTPVKRGYVSPDSNGIDEYASLYTLEKNWNIAPLAQGDIAAKNNNYQFSDIFASSSSSLVAVSFTFSPATPTVGTSVAFASTVTGGTSPYTYSWNFGDGSTSSSANPSHVYLSANTYSVSLTVTDTLGKQAKSTQIITVNGLPSFAVSTSQTSMPVMQTFSQSTTLTVSSISGFTGTISLTATVTGSGVALSLSKSSVTLSSGASTTLTLTATTTNKTTLGSYTITFKAVSGSLVQTITIPLRVNILGDVDGDGTVDIVDVAFIVYHYGSTTNSSNWNSLADLNHDGIVNIIDFELAASNYDK